VIVLHCKKPPLHILWWFFANLTRDNSIMSRIHVEKDGALAKSTAFCKFTHDEVALHLETNGRYASYLNTKVELPNWTIAQRVRAALINANRPAKYWCYSAEYAADLYYITLYSAVGMSPFQAWYGE
jgi:hypothetical protein